MAVGDAAAAAAEAGEVVIPEGIMAAKAAAAAARATATAAAAGGAAGADGRQQRQSWSKCELQAALVSALPFKLLTRSFRLDMTQASRPPVFCRLLRSCPHAHARTGSRPCVYVHAPRVAAWSAPFWSHAHTLPGANVTSC